VSTFGLQIGGVADPRISGLCMNAALESEACDISLAVELTLSKDGLFDCNYEALYALHPVSNAEKIGC